MYPVLIGSLSDSQLKWNFLGCSVLKCCKTPSVQGSIFFFNPSGMVKYLMKALQEEIVKREEIEAKYNALEARISALEGS